MIECIMQKIQDGHDKSIDSDIFLDDNQKYRRKSLYADAVTVIFSHKAYGQKNSWNRKVSSLNNRQLALPASVFTDTQVILEKGVYQYKLIRD